MSKSNVQKIIQPIICGSENKDLMLEWNHYLEMKKKSYEDLSFKEVEAHLISEVNWQMRNKAKSCEQFQVKVQVGDICYIDFGPAYVNEAGFQHFGLVMSMVNSKAFIVPMTSNEATYRQAYDEHLYPCGKRHLMRLGLIRGLKRESVLFLNDCKYINTARIIDVKAHINTRSPLFDSIKKRVIECLVSS